MELILNTYGVALNRDNDGFVITSGESKQRIPIIGIDSIQISRGAQITSDAVLLAIENNIEIIFVDKTGEPMGRVWSPKYGSISSIRKGQLNFTFTKDAAIWIRDIICKKIENQQALMLLLKADKDELAELVNKSIGRLEDYRNKVKTLDGEIVNDIAATLRGWEGQSSRIYFATLNRFLPEQFRFAQRSQHPATDVTNAFLFYLYGSAYTEIYTLSIHAALPLSMGN